jgi:hypothetical protein
MAPAASTTDVCPSRPVHSALRVRLVHVIPAADACDRLLQPRARAAAGAAGPSHHIPKRAHTRTHAKPRHAHSRATHIKHTHARARRCLPTETSTPNRTHRNSQMPACTDTNARTHGPAHAHKSVHKHAHKHTHEPHRRCHARTHSLCARRGRTDGLRDAATLEPSHTLVTQQIPRQYPEYPRSTPPVPARILQYPSVPLSTPALRC